MEEQKTKNEVPQPKSLSKALQMTYLALDTYDDVFSDFDPAPYETRMISDDLLNELTRRYTETIKGDFIVNFTVPRSQRSEKTETLIRKRLKDYFRWNLKKVEKQLRENIENGFIRIIGGIALSLLIILVPEFTTLNLVVLVSVLSWYSLWSGYERLFDASPKLKEKKIFFEKFLKAEYKFADQEELVRAINIASSYR